MQFKFNKYDSLELAQCGEAFKNAFIEGSLSGNGVWTNSVLDWFRDTAPDGSICYPSGTEYGNNEFLVDLCHTTYPQYVDSSGKVPAVQWYERALKCKCEINLALESEWGSRRSADFSRVMVLQDACKLAVLRAATKVMIFSSHRKETPSAVSTALHKLRYCHRDTSPWLWIDVPDDPTMVPNHPRAITFGVFAD